MIFNGIEKDYLIPLTGRRRSAWAPVSRVLVTVPGMAGAYLSRTETQTREIVVPVIINAENIEDLQKIKEDMAEWLVHDEPKELIFKDEPDRVYYAVVDGELELDEIFSTGRGEITFVCADPYKYGPEKTIESSSDTFIVENEGTAESDPIFELEVLQPTTFAMVSNGDEYNMVGRPISADDIAYEPLTPILNDPMTSLVGWTDATYVDNGVISGTMATDGDGFYASDFGTGTGWYGPAKKKALSEPLQDFQAQIHAENLNLSGEMGMIEVYFLDVNENTVAKLGLADAWKDVARMQAKFQLGNPNDRYEEVGEPARHSHWYDYRGIMRIARRGQEWTAYFAVIQDGIYRFPYLMKFTDFEDKYQVPIAQIQVAIRRRTAAPTNMRVNHIYVNKINQEPNGVPYIADAGDKIIFDHKTRDVYINGEPVPFDFGADFFTLKKGVNTLTVIPENTFETKVRFREKFR